MKNYTKYRDSAMQEDKPTPALFDVFKPYIYLVLLISYLVIGVFWVNNYMAIKKTEGLTEILSEEINRRMVAKWRGWNENWGRRVMTTDSCKSDTGWIVDDGGVLFISNGGKDSAYIINNGTTFWPKYTGKTYGVYGKATTQYDTVEQNLRWPNDD